MHEILPGVWHWTSHHENIGQPVHTLFLPLVGGGVLIDPRVPDAGLDAGQAERHGGLGLRGEPAGRTGDEGPVQLDV